MTAENILKKHLAILANTIVGDFTLLGITDKSVLNAMAEFAEQERAKAYNAGFERACDYDTSDYEFYKSENPLK